MISTIGFNATACPPAPASCRLLALLLCAGPTPMISRFTATLTTGAALSSRFLPPYNAHSLPALLRCLRPIGVPAVQRLKLGHCALDMAALAHCSELAALTHIRLRCMTAANDDWEAALAGLLRQAPLLSSL